MDMVPNVNEWEILEINGTSNGLVKLESKLRLKKRKKVGEVVI